MAVPSTACLVKCVQSANAKGASSVKDNNYKSHVKLGNVGYVYPHNYPNHWVEQEYLPKQLKGTKYYKKADNPSELRLNAYLEQIKKIG